MSEFLCPAPEPHDPSRKPCLAPLPCDRHQVEDAVVGQLLYGSTYLRTIVRDVPPPRPPRPPAPAGVPNPGHVSKEQGFIRYTMNRWANRRAD